MLLKYKKPSKIILNMLIKYSGDHALKIDPNSLQKYEAKLSAIFDDSAGNSPIEIVLPGFPYKSANSEDKVFGKLPDLGEEMALRKLERLRSSLSQKLKKPIHLIICSDGFAFNDLKNIPDEDVLTYRRTLKKMAAKFPNIIIKGLEDFMPDTPNEDRRKRLMTLYGTPIMALKGKLKHDKALLTLYNNLSAFAKRDLVRFEGESKKAFKTRCKRTALSVAARSKAWAGLITEHHPNAIRLTIHPYTDVSEKFPINLLPSVDGRWRTPWHNVPVITGSTAFNTAVKLSPKKDIEKTGAILNHRDGRPWCYTSEETYVMEECLKCLF